MKIYIDSDCHCHVSNPGNAFCEVETAAFDGKCVSFIEGHCYEVRENSTAVYPWKDYDELCKAQREYEREQLADAENALAILLGGVTK